MRNSVRSSPTPSARCACAALISSGRSTLPISTMRTPSAVTDGCATTSSSCAASARRRCSRPCASAISAGVGSSSTVPRVPSSTSTVPGGIFSSAPAQPITAGIPIECARIAACEVRVPSSLKSPTTCSRSSCTVSPGPSSLVTTIEGSVICSQSSSSERCIRWRTTRMVTPFRSARRSLRRVLPVAVHRSRTSSALNSNAFSAVR